jgi:ribosomal protein S12 methylthiotransferase accessory factor
MDITMTFPGGKKVDANFDGFTVRTDQRPGAGGQGSAPEPFSLFLASLGTCAGIFALGFCQSRNIPTEGLKVVQHNEWDPVAHKLGRVTIEVQAPPGFPAKYLEALRHAAENCTVKRTIFDPPSFEVTVRPAPGEGPQG